MLTPSVSHGDARGLGRIDHAAQCYDAVHNGDVARNPLQAHLSLSLQHSEIVKDGGLDVGVPHGEVFAIHSEISQFARSIEPIFSSIRRNHTVVPGERAERLGAREVLSRIDLIAEGVDAVVALKVQPRIQGAI